MGRIRAQALIFDQGNTLILDPFGQILETKGEEFGSLFRAYGFSVEVPRLIEEWNRANREVDYPHISHFLQEEPIVQHALQHLQVPTEVAALLGLDLLRAYRSAFREWILADPRTTGVREVLAGLRNRGMRLGVFSNDRAWSLAHTIRCMGIASYFEYIQSSESLGREKPDPEVFRHLLDHFRLPADQIVYVGDDPVRDIDPAKAQGMKAILYYVDRDLYRESWRDYGAPSRHHPDAIVRDLGELLDLVA
jgi:HAD superfamily hydrolase (TIGR01549 family)